MPKPKFPLAEKFSLLNSQQLNRNRTSAENRNNWPTIEQQPTNKRTNIPTDPKKTDNMSRRRTVPFKSISTTTRCRNERKKQANAGRVIFPFPFLCPDSLSFHVSKNNNQEYRS